MTVPRIELTLGPLLFNWPAERLRTFYAGIAEEAAIDRVYLGEVVCGKRAPLIGEALRDSAERLRRAGKVVVWSTLALPTTPKEVGSSGDLLAAGDLVELNDISGLAQLAPGASFVAGPLLNVYNEVAAQELMNRGCRRLCANIELPLASVACIARACPGLEIELFAYGRLPLALSSRCYHARAYGLRKDSCRFVCDRDPDGLAVNTMEGEPFLAINGVQTLSYGVHLADTDSTSLYASGVWALRLSPHSGDLSAVIAAFRRFADRDMDCSAFRAAIAAAGPPGPLVNGYLAGKAGIELVVET